MNKSLLGALKIVLFVSIGFFLLYLVFDKFDGYYQEECALQEIAPEDCSLLDRLWQDFSSANWWWLGLTIVLYLISNLSRAARWLMLLRPMGYRPRFGNSFLTVMLGYFGNLGFPRAGEVLRPTTFSSYEKIPLERTLATIVVDRLVDVLSLGIVVGLTLLLEFNKIQTFLSANLPAGSESEGISIWWLVAACTLLLLLGGLYFLRDRIRETALYGKLRQTLQGFREGLLSILYLKRPWLFLLHSVNIWLMYYLMTYLAFFAFAPTAELPPIAGLLVFTFGAFGIVIPTPGGMGTYHLLVVSGLTLFYGISGIDAFAFANLAFFSIQVGGNVLFGLISTILLPIYNKNYQPPAPLVESTR